MKVSSVLVELGVGWGGKQSASRNEKIEKYPELSSVAGCFWEHIKGHLDPKPERALKKNSPWR